MSQPASFVSLTRIFGRIGLLSFGGPAAQIALMQDELVDRHKLISQEAFLRALSFCMLLPGPEAMQLCTFIGWKLRGTLGGLLAGALFVLPGALVIFALAALYVGFGALPLVQAAFLGVQASVVVIVAKALHKLMGRALKRPLHWVIAALGFVGLFALHLPYPLLVLAAAILGAVLAKPAAPVAPAPPRPDAPPSRPLRTLLIWGSLWALPFGLAFALDQSFLLGLMTFFSKLAVVTFGGAYAVLAYMTQTVVQDQGWITTQAMIDALGLAETTPGPLILVTQFVATLAGEAQGGLAFGLMAGLAALWVTFVPCFLWIFLFAPHLDRLMANPRLEGALSAVTAGVVGVILNLSLWFALHVIFGKLYTLDFGPVSMIWPAFESLSLHALALIALAAGLMRVLPLLGVLPLMGAIGALFALSF